MKLSQKFDYNALEPGVRQTARARAKEIRERLETSSRLVVEIGRLLLGVRGLLAKDVFAGWLLAEFGWRPHTADVYITAAERFGGLTCIGRIQPRALHTLSRSTVPAGAIDEAIRRAEGGHTITNELAKALCEDHRRPRGIPAANEWHSPLRQSVTAAIARSVAAVTPAVLPYREADDVAAYLETVREGAYQFEPARRRVIAAALFDLAEQLARPVAAERLGGVA